MHNTLLINIVMIISLFNGIWWLICNVTGNLFFKVIAKGILGFGGLLLPTLYLLKMYNVI